MPSELPQDITAQVTGRVAIIDIGSNSIRMVVYDSLKRAAVPLYNEKVMCQLGKGLASSGKLNPAGVELARDAIRRYLALSRNMEVSGLHIVATAAVRDAEDGPAFAASVEKAHGIKVHVISGEEEAKLGAYGICSSIHHPRGLSGDLGGGSLELVQLEDTRILDHATLPLGTLRLIDQTKGNRAEMRKRIETGIESLPWLTSTKPDAFYAIGGTFRTIASLHMDEMHYPLHIVHEYTVPAKQLLPFVRKLAEMGDDKLEKVSGLPGKRAPAVPAAAMILERVIETIRPTQIVFSASGIREGYLYDMLAPHLRAQDPLLSACYEIARGGKAAQYAQELLRWINPLFAGETEADHRLRWAFCLLADVAHHIHPEYRAEWAMQRVLQSAFTGITHSERVQLALALYHRYQFKLKDEPAVLQLLEPRQKQWARLAGASANLAYHLTGSVPGSLAIAQLKADMNSISLVLDKSATDLMGDAVKRRIGGVAEAYASYLEKTVKV